MKIKLAYGEKGLVVNIPDKNLLKVLDIKEAPPLRNLSASIQKCLERPLKSQPLRELASGKKKAVIVISDQTRPIPYRDILPPLLNTFTAGGLGRENITILIATGVHRPSTDQEIEILVGKDIAKRFNIINHFSRNKKDHRYMGKTRRGTPVYIDRLYLESDLKIVTGLIEPHLLAGYSGGRKAICPGLVSVETMYFVHGPGIIDHPKARVGILKGNPFHEEALAMARKAGIDFCLNVVINSERKVTQVLAGDFEAVHEAGVRFLDKFNKFLIPESPDIIITTGGGAPLDNTFYQSVKGPNSVRGIIRRGGVVILAAACREGLGSKEFSHLLTGARDVREIMAKIRRPGFFVVDQWMVQHLGHVLERAEVYLYSHNIETVEKFNSLILNEVKDLAKRLLVKPISSVEEGIKLALDKMGRQAKILVIPSGPYVIPTLR